MDCPIITTIHTKFGTTAEEKVKLKAEEAEYVVPTTTIESGSDVTLIFCDDSFDYSVPAESEECEKIFSSSLEMFPVPTMLDGKDYSTSKEGLFTVINDFNKDGAGSFQCGQCSKVFISKERLREHIAKFHKPKSCAPRVTRCKNLYRCAKCGMEFETKRNLELHKVAAHRVNQPYQCDRCGKYFSEQIYLTAHIAAFHRENRRYVRLKPQFQCSHCDIPFSTFQNLLPHLTTVHGDHEFAESDWKPVQCGHCDKYSFDMRHLKRHMAVHLHGNGSGDSPPFVCGHCYQRFPWKTQIQAHLIIHGGCGQRIFSCEYCPRSFARSQRLSDHTSAVHMSGNNFRCEKCARIFVLKGSFLGHVFLHENPNVVFLPQNSPHPHPKTFAHYSPEIVLGL